MRFRKRRLRKRAIDDYSENDYQQIMHWWGTRDDSTQFFLISEIYSDYH